MFIHFGEITPIAFHPYTSTVMKRIFKVEYNNGDQIDRLRDELINIFNEAGIKAYRDNKIAFECEMYGQRIFYGFYDWGFSIGFECHHR